MANNRRKNGYKSQHHNFKNEEFKPKGTPKIYVLDTNIILHDHRAIFNFQDNDLVIPIAVIEELDKFKKGNDTLNYNARSFLRDLDKVASDKLFEGGISLGKNHGTIKVERGHPFSSEMKDSLMEDIPDHRILATTQWLIENNPGRKVALVSKDINLRMKAKALGIPAQDYLTDRLNEERLEFQKKEVVTVNKNNPDLLKRLRESEKGLPFKDLSIRTIPAGNQLYKFIEKNGKECKTTLARYNASTKNIVVVEPRSAYGIEPRNNEQVFALDALFNPEIKLVSLTGGSGTGKTLLSLAAALEQESDYTQILLSRPVIPLKNQELGFLPGDINDKIGPYMLPLFDNLSVIKNNFKSTSREVVKIEDMLRTEKLLINPLAYIRGRSLSNVFFIVDEAQNLTPHEIKTIITRAGEGTKIVFTGDVFQIDQPYLDIYSNGLTHIGDKLFGEPIFAHINLFRGERSELSELADKLL